MANVKISELTAITSVDATDLFEVSEDTGSSTFASKKATATQVSAFTRAAPDGSASAPAYSFSADSNTGIYRVGNDVMGFSVNGAQVVDVSSGSLSHLGTGSSAAKLLGGTSDGAALQLNRGGSASQNAYLSQYQGALFIKNLDSGDIVFTTTTSDTERARISSTGYLGVNNASPAHYVDVISNSATVRCVYATQQNASGYTINADATSSSYAASVHLVVATRAANTAYSFFDARSSGATDIEFNLRGDGTGLCDGSWTGGGADYAEYFEWADGNPDNEDRRGYSVVLDGTKIRKALVSDADAAIIGVVSGTPSVVGDAAWNRWSGKYLRDDFGSYIMEDYEVWSWTETVVEPGPSGVPVTREVQHSYAADAVPDGVTVPADKTVAIQQRRTLNPAYDPDAVYVPREERPEWSAIGLVGKLRVHKGQPVGERWIKMRDVSDAVEEWLVR